MTSTKKTYRAVLVGKTHFKPDLESMKGLSQFVSGDAKLSECVKQVGETGQVYVMPAGPVPPNPQELLSSHRFSEALEQLSKAFDHVIIDCADCRHWVGHGISGTEGMQVAVALRPLRGVVSRVASLVWRPSSKLARVPPRRRSEGNVIGDQMVDLLFVVEEPQIYS